MSPAGINRFLGGLLAACALVLLVALAVALYLFARAAGEHSALLDLRRARAVPAPGEERPAPTPAAAARVPSVVGRSGAERKYAPGIPRMPVPVAPAAGAPAGAGGAHPILESPCRPPWREFAPPAGGTDFEARPGPREVALHLRISAGERGAPRAEPAPRSAVIRMRFLGADPAMPTAAGPQAGQSHYFLGSDRERWVTGVPCYPHLRCGNVYPGTDLILYSDRDRLEYLLLTEPDMNLDRIRLGFEGAERLALDEQGNLTLDFGFGKLVQGAPRACAVVGESLRPVPVRFVVEDGLVGFAMDSAEAARTPFEPGTLDQLSFLGGPGGEQAYALALDGAGYAYVAGETSQPDFSPARLDAWAGKDNIEVFVTKFRIADGRHVYTVFLGGQSQDRAFAVAADAEGRAYVCGETLSRDFPTTREDAPPRSGESWDAFVARLSADGSVLEFCGRIGGSADDRAYGIALDAEANVYLAGETSSDDFPFTGGFPDARLRGTWDAFVLKLLARKTAPAYAMRLGGSGDDAAYGLAVDAAGNVFAAGETSSPDFPASRLLPPGAGGLGDGFVVKLAPDGTAAVFTAIVGGDNDDRILGVCADAAGNAILAGETASTNFPAVHAFQPRHAGGNWDAFVTKLAADGSAAVFSTYLGGAGDDRGFAVAADMSGGAYLAGGTASRDLATARASQAAYGGGPSDGWMAALDPGGGRLQLSYLGGAGADALQAMAVDGARGVHVAGGTASPNLPIVNALQARHHGGGSDALLAGAGSAPLQLDLRPVPAGGQPGGPAYDYYLSRGEIANSEFVRFLNDAQVNTNNARGEHMFFDARGNVWFNPGMQPETHEMFNIRRSRIQYDAERPVGVRYRVSLAVPAVGGSYAKHPVTGVSWFGAVKFCNWLTLEGGRSLAARCYREGTNALDWTPITAPEAEWSCGRFSAAARAGWLRQRGFRLPMDNCDGAESASNPYNEFYKAAAWNGRTNMPYGFGREQLRAGDANYLDDGVLQRHDTTPVGFYGGSVRDGTAAAHPEANAYGIWDLSGNVAEWLNDPAGKEFPHDRACYGGSWMFALAPVSQRLWVSPHFTDNFRGFRVATTFCEPKQLVARVPYRLCLREDGELVSGGRQARASGPAAAGR